MIYRMIGFAELRKRATQWQTDIAAVERIYVIDWMIKGIFDDAALSQMLVLRGAAALRYAHCRDYPIAPDPEFLAAESPDENFETIVKRALQTAAQTSELKLNLVDFGRTGGKVEYTGPLGRRSAAQPRVTLAVLPGRTRLAPARTQLIHPFDDHCAATVSAVALEEIAAEGISMLGLKPRARDVFDTWFVLAHTRAQMDSARIGSLVRDIAKEKNAAIARGESPFDAAPRAGLSRAWESVMRGVRGHPSFDQVETDLADALKFIVPE